MKPFLACKMVPNVVGAADADTSLMLTWSAFGVIILSMYSLPLLATHSENWYYGHGRRSVDGWAS